MNPSLKSSKKILKSLHLMEQRKKEEDLKENLDVQVEIFLKLLKIILTGIEGAEDFLTNLLLYLDLKK